MRRYNCCGMEKMYAQGKSSLPGGLAMRCFLHGMYLEGHVQRLFLK